MGNQLGRFSWANTKFDIEIGNMCSDVIGEFKNFELLSGGNHGVTRSKSYQRSGKEPYLIITTLSRWSGLQKKNKISHQLPSLGCPGLSFCQIVMVKKKKKKIDNWKVKQNRSSTGTSCLQQKNFIFIGYIDTEKCLFPVQNPYFGLLFRTSQASSSSRIDRYLPNLVCS